MPLPALPAAELDALLVWVRAPRVTAQQLSAAIAAAGSARAALAAGRTLWREIGLDPGNDRVLAEPDPGTIAADRAWLGHPRHHLLLAGSAQWPSQLDALPDAPAGLYVVGDPDTVWLPQIAIVGARAASPIGLELGAEFAQWLSAAGLVVTSGLADGIDTAAHTAALAASGRTLAVCGTGLDRTYPERNAPLAARIAARGAMVSEFALGRPPLAEHFPRRNRIIAALSLATLVIEAGLRSGSLITARIAAELGREVMALPGSVRNPRVRGCHQLIRQGAALVETPEEVLELLRPALTQLKRQITPAAGTPMDDPSETGTAVCDDPAQRLLLEALGHDPIDVDRLIARTGLTAGTVSSMLQALELDGLVARMPGGLLVRNRRPTPRNAVSRGRG